MMKYKCLLALLVLAGCAKPTDSTIDYDEPWNTPTISHKAMDYKYVNFGSIGFYDRSFSEDTLAYPPIPGLVHASRLAVTKNGNGANYATLAIRCPEKPGLLKWMAGRVKKYVTDWPIGYDQEGPDPVADKVFNNTEELVGYYMDRLGESLKEEAGEDFPTMTHQTGLLLADCWQQGELYTFYESVWDNESHLNHEGYVTVNARTGKALELEDFDPIESPSGLFFLVWQILKDVLSWECISIDGKGILQRLSGCGLIREGLALYWYPYNLCSGADGETWAIVPQEELQKLQTKSEKINLHDFLRKRGKR